MLSRDDILRMAREAQWLGNIEGWTFNSYDELERFFKLAYEAGAAAEREACAQVGMLVAKNGIETSAVIRARGQPDPKVTHLNEWARDRLARHGIPEPDEGNPSFG